MTNFFYQIYLWIASRKLIASVGLLLVVLGLLFLASKITFEEDITKLIPTSSENEAAQKVLKTVNFADKIIVNITRESGASVEDLTQYASQFIDSLEAHSTPYYTQIQGKIPDETVLNALDFVYYNLPLFLEAEDYKTIQSKLNSDSLQALTKAHYKTLISPSGFVAKETILRDPLGLSFIALKKMQQLSFGDAFVLENGFLLSKDKQHLLLFISPTHKSSETSENALFAEQLYSLSDQLNDEYKNTVKSEFFGGALIAVANAKQIKLDIQITVTIAMSILLLILIVFYRKISIPLILFTPTAFGALLAIALLFIIRTNISAISLGIGSVLLGITLDYALHILTHIRSNNDVKALYKEITKPVLMSSLTTALAFLCLLFLKSQALQDLGIFAAISVLGSSVFSLIFVPQVYRFSEKSQKQKTILDTAAKYPFHKNKWLIGGLMALFILSMFTYSQAGFNNDISQLNYEPKALMDAQKRLDALTNIQSKSVYLAAYGSNSEEALETNDLVFSKLQKLKNEQNIIDFSSIGALVQSQKQQQTHLDIWQNFWQPEKVLATKEHLIASGEKFGFKPSTFNQFYNLLETDFETLDLDDFKTLNTISIDDYISESSDFSTVTSLVKVEDEQAEALIETFKSQPQTLVIDRKQMNETFLGGLKTDFNRLVGYSLLVVLVLLLLFYRSISLTLVTALPIALTWLLTIGIMGLTGIQFNIFNIIISTFIFGLGIDYSIFITNGLLHELKTRERVLPTHKTSIILSVITTILGVGVLIFAKHPALFSISLVSIVGIISALCISFILQPLFFKFFIGSKTNRPAPVLLVVFSSISFLYYGLGGLFLSIFGMIFIRVIPVSMKKKMGWFHNVMSTFMKSVLISYPFIRFQILNSTNETFKKPAVIIANHTSFLDILAVGMLHPKIIFLVNDWVYNSPFFGKAVKLAGFYPVSSGIENGVSHLQKKVDQGYSLMIFPEGTRSYTHKMKRFHKGAFYLADQFKLDIVPVIIHGNSEILPKGNFVIKHGLLSMNILKRIAFDDTSFGNTIRERTKMISAHFKSEFKNFRAEHESPTYFHSMVLEDYRYKDYEVFQTVKTDLKNNQNTYKFLLDTLRDTGRILHISNTYGQLDFLLAVDSPSRNIITYLEEPEARKLVKSSFITNNNYKIEVVENLQNALEISCENIIINATTLTNSEIETLKAQNAHHIILLFESIKSYLAIFENDGYQISRQTNTLIFLSKP
ncbi:1-acyl-sn-glycerol-3-phosphate acyltransferase [Bizionia myxarmorum]|uniref:MMPL family transporter n=1 Tax=Bizionia myxarmorum TaxID=291186 RepID=A0A5D0RC27_9FLAO|nr:1-acyl-sn-glycerol-3-phosphate acyltransferase [Bizionia myxarmorum]TYB78599.1 MMPL family transporter [Bizionia myxarmorum]